MKVELHDRFSVTIIPETVTERVDLANVAGLKPTDPNYLDLYTGKTPSITPLAHRSSTEGGGGWMRHTVTTDYLTPYWERLVRQFGATPVDLDFGPVLDAAGRIGHTYLAESLVYSAETKLTTWTSVFELFPYIGERFPDQAAILARADREAREDIANFLGASVYPREYIEVGNGLFKKNPDWGRARITYRPGVENSNVWKFMCDWWRQTQATPGQLALLERATKYWREPTAWNFAYDNHNQVMKWEEFSQLK
jgi:hypothetical protein